jgi:hypothetical protein
MVSHILLSTIAKTELKKINFWGLESNFSHRTVGLNFSKMHLNVIELKVLELKVLSISEN